MRVALIAVRWAFPGVGLLSGAIGWVLLQPGDRVAVQWTRGGAVSQTLDAWIYLALIAAGYSVMWIGLARASPASGTTGRRASAAPARLLMSYVGLGVILGAHVEVATASRAAIEAATAMNHMAWDGPLAGATVGLLAGTVDLAVSRLGERAMRTYGFGDARD